MGPVELQLIQNAYATHSRLISSSGPLLQHENEQLKLLVKKLVNRVKDLEREVINQSVLECENPVMTIIDFVCKNEKVSKRDIIADRRTSNLVYIRHIIYYLCCSLTKYSLPTIGRVIHRDHTTIMHGRNWIKAQMGKNPKLDEKIARYRAALLCGVDLWPA